MKLTANILTFFIVSSFSSLSYAGSKVGWGDSKAETLRNAKNLADDVCYNLDQETSYGAEACNKRYSGEWRCKIDYSCSRY